MGGVPYMKSMLYDDENQEYKKKYPDQFRYEYAISREQKNAAGQKMYIQTKVAEYANEVWDLLQYPKTHVYMCGLKGMESGMAEALGPIAESKGLQWTDLVKQWKKAGRWHVEFIEEMSVSQHHVGAILLICFRGKLWLFTFWQTH